ncbi:hypothetical protein M885DRAFT_559149 [Pelagophyceae sp. CCMP2097]|nr:hypothetical protein M885DRAFT_559149 [Pelagophyceae sp. CCMP2097]
MDSRLCRVRVCVHPGTCDLKSKVMTVYGASSFVAIFEKIVGELSEDLAPRVGDLQRVTLTLGPDEAEPEESSDPAGKYFNMGLKAITFVVSQRAAAARRRTIHPDLPRESMAGELPNWADAGHPAYDKLFQKLRGVFKEDGCLFRDDTAFREVHAPDQAESPARRRRAAVRVANDNIRTSDDHTAQRRVAPPRAAAAGVKAATDAARGIASAKARP